MRQIEILDSSLRDGAQAEGIFYSLEDKLRIAYALDRIGIGYIEAGNPASNPKDMELFRRVSDNPFQNAKLVAFGATRRPDISAEKDPGCAALAAAGTDYVSIFGKSWDLHVSQVLNTSLPENLQMIRDTVSYFTRMGRTVFFDAEHFFDGYRNNPAYAVQTIQAAEEAGAARIILCDTNGGSFPEEIAAVIKAVRGICTAPLGIHCHNDMGCAVAASLMAAEAGCQQIQGTFLGYGERCGNANLSAIIPTLQLKKKYRCIPGALLPELTHTARYIAEIANYIIPASLPYVGKSAFSHKGGMHVDGVQKLRKSFEHIDPEAVGNRRNLLVSEMAGRTAILNRIMRVDPSVTKFSPITEQIIAKIKELEYHGYQFETALASVDVLIYKELGRMKEYFTLRHFKIIGEQSTEEGGQLASALIKIQVGDQEEITAAEGAGPVHALDRAMRKALEVFYPSLAKVRLIDYKVRVMTPEAATAAAVRVLIESTDGENVWTTVGASPDIIEASWKALVDSIEYKLLKDDQKG
ncbi:MAG: citramalate synthase [Oscillospiraceae bacterium]|nr:citramalate synthase [Oscillospiraceae bacterium]